MTVAANLLTKAISGVPVIWTPIYGSSQQLATDEQLKVNHILYTGARGPGKTDAQLMRFVKRVGRGYGSYWKGVLFDREYKNLDDVVTKSKRWFPRFINRPCRFLESKSDYKWVWSTGEELLFRSIKASDDYWNYHGQEFPWIGWNELCKYPTRDLYEKMMSCNRSSYTPEKDGIYDDKGILISPTEIPLEVFATTNSYGPGHNWVKADFIDVAPFGEVVKTKVRVYSPKLKEEVDVIKSQVTIHGSWRENPYLAPDYIAELMNIEDDNIRKSWLDGDWDIVAGGALDDKWVRPKVILKRFKIPSGWRIDRSMDWGSSHPAWVGWWAEANGEEAVLPDGSKFCPPARSLILINEWYMTHKIGSNKGLKLSATAIAKGVLERNKQLTDDGWICTRVYGGPADNQIRDVRESDVDTIEKKMADEGVEWMQSDKSPGSRRNGLQLIRDRLEATKEALEKPRLYCFEHCLASIATIPSLPRDDLRIDDVDTTAEDHPYDGWRYRVLAGANRTARGIKVAIPY